MFCCAPNRTTRDDQGSRASTYGSTVTSFDLVLLGPVPGKTTQRPSILFTERGLHRSKYSCPMTAAKIGSATFAATCAVGTKPRKCSVFPTR